MTQTMLHVDSAQSRMPVVCTVIAALVWTVSVAICIASWLFAKNDPTPAKSVDAPAMEARGGPGRRF